MGDLQHLLLALCSQDEVAELVEGMDLHRRFVRDSLRPAQQWRKMYRATKRTDS